MNKIYKNEGRVYEKPFCLYPPLYKTHRFVALACALFAFLAVSCGELVTESNTSISIKIPVEQIENISSARAAWSEDATVYNVAVTLYVNGKPKTQRASGTPLQISKKTFVFRNIPRGFTIKAAAQLTKDGVIWSGESGEVKLSSGKADLQIPMHKTGHVHTWDTGIVTKEPTGTTEGVKTFTCTDCGATKTEVMPVLGHTHNIVTTQWYSDDYYHWNKADCSNEEHIANKNLHDWEEDVTTAATCTVPGIKTSTCGVCKKEKTATISATGHSWATSYSSDETYHWYECAKCDEIKNKTAHTWDAGKVTTQPTTSNEGVKTYTCTACEKTKTETIPKICYLKVGSDFNSAIKNKTKIEKVVFGLLSDTAIRNVVSDATVAATKVDVGVNADTYGAYYDSTDKTLYIVPADENATKIVFNERCYNLFEDFSECKSIEGLNFVDTSNVTSMMQMFYGCKKLEKLDVSGFDTSKVTDMQNMFGDCNALTSLDVSKFDTSQVTNMGSMFSDCNVLESLDVSKFDTSNVTNMGRMFAYCYNLAALDVSGFKTSKVTDMSSMFSYCSKVTVLDVSGFDTSNVTSMGSMFSGCSGVGSLDVGGFNTSNVTSMAYMFSGCSDLSSLDVSGFDTSNVTSMSDMFNHCSGLTIIDVSGFKTSKVTSMLYMFAGCSKVGTLDVSKFDTSAVVYMGNMFYGCSNVATLDVSGFDTSNVTSMGSMFSGCSGLSSLDLSSFNTEKVEAMVEMFSGCSNITSLDLSSFNTAKVTTMEKMFFNCTKLATVLVTNASDFVPSVCNTMYMFDGCGANSFTTKQ